MDDLSVSYADVHNSFRDKVMYEASRADGHLSCIHTLQRTLLRQRQFQRQKHVRSELRLLASYMTLSLKLLCTSAYETLRCHVSLAFENKD